MALEAVNPSLSQPVGAGPPPTGLPGTPAVAAGGGADSLAEAAEAAAIASFQPSPPRASYNHVIYPWDTIALTPENCNGSPGYAKTFPPGLLDAIPLRDRCNVCERVVHNSWQWNWKQHYSALCTRVPAHLLDLCRHYACVMASQCPEFITGTCSDEGSERFPCPPKYTCWNCLRIPEKQVAGCFDNADSW